jgi:hypothetical protein
MSANINSIDLCALQADCRRFSTRAVLLEEAVRAARGRLTEAELAADRCVAVVTRDRSINIDEHHVCKESYACSFEWMCVVYS